MLGRIKFAVIEDVMLEVAMDQLPVYKGGENAGIKNDEQVSSLVSGSMDELNTIAI